MTSRQRLGLIIAGVGLFLFLRNMFPNFIQEIIQAISMPVILMILGLYLFLSKK